MLCRLKLRILLQAVTLCLLGPACAAASLGFTVHAVPLESDEGKTVGDRCFDHPKWELYSFTFNFSSYKLYSP